MPTPPFTLRPPTQADAPAILRSVQASLPELSPWLPWATAAYTEADVLRWIDGEFGDVHRYLIVNEQDEHMGTVGINGLDLPNRRGNLGYWIQTPYGGRGLASEATRQVAQIGLSDPRFERLEILMSVENEGSRRVAEKAGAHYEGIARARVHLLGRQHDAHVFSLTRADFAL